MATQLTPSATFWLILILVGLTITLSSTCHNCSKKIKTFYCSSALSEAEKYTLDISDYNGTRENSLYLECNYKATHIDLNYHKGCNFSSVQYVTLKKCPLFNVSFSEAFAKLGIQPDKVLGLIFENVGTRRDMKLERWHLDGLQNLEVLELKRNLFTTIPPDLLQSTPKLQHFIFSRNNMSTVPETLFAGASNLKSIHLISNNFTSLPDYLFLNISTLTRLTVYDNALGEINPKLLSSIPNVYRLELSLNKITKLTSETFSHLPKLKRLKLKSNELESLPEDIFHNCPDLEIVNLQKNKLQTLPSQLFSKSNMITDFKFDINKVTEIPRGIFQGLINLTILSMSTNSIEKIPEDLFVDLINLEELSLQNNPLKILLPETFDNQHKLRKISLKNTSLSDLPSHIFRTCESLQIIDLSLNHLSELKSTFFPHPVSDLRVLDLSSNNLSFSAVITRPTAREAEEEVLLEQFPLSDQVRLTNLILDNNRIRAIPHALRKLQNLKNLDLRNNSIEYLDYYDFLLSSDPTHLDVINASLADTSQDIGISHQVVAVKLQDNPLICDCNLYKFSRLLQESISEEDKSLVRLQVVDSTSVKCSPPNNRSIQQLVITLDITSLVCYRKECHPSCSCAIRPHDQMFIMDCASQGLQAIPKLEPYLPKGNYSVTLNVKNNSIASLEGLQSPAYDTLVNLTMPHNYLKVINESFLPKTLQVLDVSRNALTNFCPSLISFLNATDANLSLGGNPWLCDCQLIGLHTFLRDPHRKVCQLSSRFSNILDNKCSSLSI